MAAGVPSLKHLASHAQDAACCPRRGIDELVAMSGEPADVVDMTEARKTRARVAAPCTSLARLDAASVTSSAAQQTRVAAPTAGGQPPAPCLSVSAEGREMISEEI